MPLLILLISINSYGQEKKVNRIAKDIPKIDVEYITWEEIGLPHNSDQGSTKNEVRSDK